ncbi:MAG: NCS2 family permease [candidate division KSB1 bacterium]|nr:NCS2 family permease [candidate division KSB1 bacterium]MDZ7303373.1 NCS2 family permease [candidate division KSB1 bacterium]MDZ7312309.1 NCS2 family permease [candidate division KSB1 bacterium]
MAKFFNFAETGTTFRRETIAGLTTFATMSYIIFVNPAILSAPDAANMNFGAVMVATCVSSAIGTLLMAFLANYPIALAPGMGINAYFSFSVCQGLGIPWQTALAGVFFSGVLFIVLALFRFREKIISSIPDSLKNAIAIGIGLLIAFVGLKEGGIIAAHPETFVRLASLREPIALLTLFGLLVTAILLARRVVGALLLGIVVTALLALLLGLVKFQGVFSFPPSMAPTFFKMDLKSAFDLGFVTIIIVFFFVDLFDTVGTLVGVGEQAGFLKEGQLPRGGRALMADAIATSVGAVCGTSTVVSYIESASGVAEGGRTGFANLITAALFILALFLSPLAQMIGGGIQVGSTFYHPITAPALIIVGSMMVQNVLRIDWKDFTEAIPAFLTLISMPLTFSIADGMALGFISYPIVKLAAGRGREVSLAVYILMAVFLVRYLFLLET